MKMNTKLVLVLTFMLVVSSCNDSDIIVENANSGISIDKCTIFILEKYFFGRNFARIDKVTTLVHVNCKSNRISWQNTPL